MTKPKADPDRIAENIQRRELSPGVEGAGRRSTLAAGLFVLSVALGILLIWRTSSSLLIIFAGILFASFLDACGLALGPVIPIGRAWRLTLVILILTALIVLGVIWGVGKVPEQARVLIRVMDAQLDVLQQRLQSVGVDLFGPDGDRDLSRWFPDHNKLFGHAQTAVGTTSGILANTLVILFLGLLFSFDPRAYRDGFLLLVKPSSRGRVRTVLDETGSILRLWLVGQLIRIVLMAACVWLALYLLGLPGAFLLGVQAGVSNFLSRSHLGCNPGGVGSHASRHLDTDLGRWNLYYDSIDRRLRDWTSHSASGRRIAPGVDFGCHCLVRRPVWVDGYYACNAFIGNRSRCCPPALC